MKTFCTKSLLGVLIICFFALSATANTPPPWYPCSPSCNLQCYNCDNYHDSDGDGYGNCTPKSYTCNNCSNYTTEQGSCREDGTYCIGSALQKGSITSTTLKAGKINTLSASAGSDSDCHNTTDSCGHSCTEPENDPVIVTWSASAGSFPGGTTGTSVAWQAPNEVGQVEITASWANNPNTDKVYETGGSQTITMTIVDPNTGKAKATSPETDPVTLTGNFTAYARDMTIKGRAMDIVIERNYSSDSDNGVGDAGFAWGWDMSCHIKVRPQTDPAVIRFYDGHNKPLAYRRSLDGDPTIYLPPPGRYDRLVKNANNTYTLTEKDGTKYNFNSHNDIENIVDRLGNTIMQFEYNGSYRLATITSDLGTGHTATLTYYASGLLETITDDFAERTWTYGYDGSGNLTTVTTPLTTEYPSGLTTTYGYSGHNLTTITDPNDDIWLINTYTDGKVTSQQYGTGTSYLEFHPDANYAKITDRNGFDTNSVYNAGGLVTKETVYTKTLRAGEPASYVTRYEYDANSELVKKILPGGNYITYAYDANGNTTVIAAEPNNGDPNIVARFSYEHKYNRIKTITDPCENVITYTYDYEAYPGIYNTNVGNLMKITYPDCGLGQPTVQFTYNSYGQVETITDPNELVIQLEYYSSGNGKGQLWKVRVDPSGLDYTTTCGYDIYGNVTSITDANGAATSFAYNALDQLVSTTDPHNHVISMAYNPSKMLKEISQSIGASTQRVQYAYDILDKVKAVTNPLGYVTRYGFNKKHDVNDVNDAEGNHTRYTYDSRDLLWKVTDANGGVMDVNYTPNGMAYTVRDANGNITTYTYDKFDRLTRITYPNSSYEQFTYDRNSNMLSKRSRKGDTLYYTYDALNRLKTKTLPGNKVTTYYYDIAGRLVEVNDNGSHTYNYYDRFGRLFKTTNSDSRDVKYAYDKLGRRTKLTYPDDTYILYYYDAMSRLTDINDQSNNRIVHYSYDALSRRTAAAYGNGTSTDYSYSIGNQLDTLTDSLDTMLAFMFPVYDKVGNSKTVVLNTFSTFSYTYDNRYQLTSVDYPAGWNAYDTNYHYDRVGNRTSTVAGSTTSYFHNRLNQYYSVGGTYTYDNNGNLANDGTYKYYYDAENRLIDANTVGNVRRAQYAYDYQNRRVSRTTYYDGTVATTYVYDGAHIIAEYEGATLTKKYVFGPNIDEPVLMTDAANGNAKYYYHFDGGGSVIAMTDSGGQTVQSYYYDAFGVPVITVGTLDNRFMFTGREYDGETGNYYYRAREYNPYIGRFLQPDPIGYYDSMNLYQYCGNNPANFTDPWGNYGISNTLKNPLVTITTANGRTTTYQVQSRWDLMAVLKDQASPTNQITKFDWLGHGVDGMLALSNSEYLAGNNPYLGISSAKDSDLANTIKNNFSPNALIQLRACESASGQDSIASEFKQLLPNATVVGYGGKAALVPLPTGNLVTFGWFSRWQEIKGGP